MPEPAEPVYETFTATAYTADCEGCSGITYTGIDVKQTEYDEDGRRIIAVDPAVIPLGSAVLVRLADGYTFTAVAEDVGGGIDGREIDVLMPDRGRAIEFGRQDVEVRILKDGRTRIINEKGAD